MAKNNVQSVFYLLCTQVIKLQVIKKTQNQSSCRYSWQKKIATKRKQQHQHTLIKGHSNSRHCNTTYHTVINLLDKVVAEVDMGHMIPTSHQLSAILSLPSWYLL